MHAGNIITWGNRSLGNILFGEFTLGNMSWGNMFWLNHKYCAISAGKYSSDSWPVSVLRLWYEVTFPQNPLSLVLTEGVWGSHRVVSIISKGLAFWRLILVLECYPDHKFAYVDLCHIAHLSAWDATPCGIVRTDRELFTQLRVLESKPF